MNAKDTLDMIRRTCPNITLKVYEAILEVLKDLPLDDEGPHPLPFAYPSQSGTGVTLQFEGYKITVEQAGSYSTTANIIINIPTYPKNRQALFKYLSAYSRDAALKPKR